MRYDKHHERGLVFTLGYRLCVVVAALVAGAAVAPSAGAWKYVIQKGSPGSVTVAQVVPYEDGRFTTYGPYVSFLTFDLPYVTRSPATSDAQQVQGAYILQRWNGSAWYTVISQQTPVYTIPAGRSGIYLPKLYRSPSVQRGYFRISWLVAWESPGGSDLGSARIDPSKTSDFRCQAMVRPCAVSDSWVRLGRANALGGGW